MKMLGQAAPIAIAAVLLSACATTPAVTGPKKDAIATTQPAITPEGMDPIATAAFWGTRYEREPSNPDIAVDFSRSLRAVGNNKEALRVTQQISTRTAENPAVLLEHGKALIANERAHEAVRPIERAIALGQSDDWSAYSSLGVAFDMIGDHKRAREEYGRALAIAPGEPKILNNLGLSHALAAQPVAAERNLRLAAANPAGTARMRQNLALVLAMAGKKAEATRLVRSDLPPQVAENNLGYYQTLVAPAAYWGDLDRADLDLPEFGSGTAETSNTMMSAPVPDPVTAPGARSVTPKATPSIKAVPAPTTSPAPQDGEVQAAVQPEAQDAPMELAFSRD